MNTSICEIPETRTCNTAQSLAHQAPVLAKLDFLGRMPVPVRRPFKAGLDRVVTDQAERGTQLECCFLRGGEWYKPFDALARAATVNDVPDLIVTTLQEDILSPKLLSFYEEPRTERGYTSYHPAFTSGKLFDPTGTFRTFAAVPFVFLVDVRRLAGRPIPRAWSDLLEPRWHREIVFGGWRPNESVDFKDFNSYLLLSILQEFGASGLLTFASNVHHLQHNVRTTTLFGTNSQHSAAIAILPWLHAEMCPHRAATRVVWPQDGAIAMPIGCLTKSGRRSRVAPLIDYVTGPELARVLGRNCYPAARTDTPNPMPINASFKWLGWQYVYSHDLTEESERAARVFFSALNASELRACA
jgi:ABC-type Fe3+ transport system substrate-binding protein